MNKKDARNLIKERRMNLSMEYIETASDKIFEKLLENEDFKMLKLSCLIWILRMKLRQIK